MGLVQRFRQRRQKLEHIRERAKVILPLCEEATGIKLKGKLKIEATNKFKLRIRYMADVFGGAGSQENAFSDPIHNLMLGIGLRKLICGSVESAYGYYDPSRVLIGIRLDGYAMGNAMSEYVLAHEIVHLLVGQEGSHKQVNKDKVLSEGAATFYGSEAIRKAHPDFDITERFDDTENPLLYDAYRKGYEFFKAAASVVEDPLLTISATPPGKCLVQSRHCGESYVDDETGHPAKYLERLRKRTTPSVKHQEWGLRDLHYYPGKEEVTKKCFRSL